MRKEDVQAEEEEEDVNVRGATLDRSLSGAVVRKLIESRGVMPRMRESALDRNPRLVPKQEGT